MKVAFFEVKPWEEDYIKEKLKDSDLSFFTEKLSKDNVGQVTDFQVISLFTDSPVDKEVFSQLSGVKIIATRSTGFDHIDLAVAKERGVTVCNVPLYGENTVAEHAFALILSLSRKLFDSIERSKKGDFSLDGLTGFDLKDKIIGIIGMGHIGMHVARIAKGFEMNVLAYDINQDEKLAEKIGFGYTTLEDLLSKSDIISLHAPNNKATYHMLNENNMPSIKKGAYLVNTARGGLVETSALLKALNDGTLAGAGLDVLEEECFIMEEAQLLSKEFPKTCDVKILLENNMLLRQKNVIITPHNAFNSREALTRILDTTIENIDSFIKGKPINVIK